MINTINFQTLCHQVCQLAKEVGNFIRNEQDKINAGIIEVKSSNSFVTYVDKTSEERLIAALSRLLPESGFIAEENTSSKIGKIYNWIIDPLDGTTNFIHSIPCYSISIALKQENEMVLGVVYEINLDECFYAWKDSNAFLNNKEIHVSQATLLKDSLIATGFPYYDYGKLDEYMKLFQHFVKHTHGLRRLGSAAVDLAYVACGRFEGFYEYGLNSWDVAAGTFIVQQAGGKVADFKGDDNYIFGKEIIASNSLIFDEFLDDIKKYF